METLLHPMVVHFPIALLITSVLFDVAGMAVDRDSLREGALWLLILGLLGGVAASVTGGLAEEAAERAGIAESLIETHETLAHVTLAIFGGLLAWRLLLRNRIGRRVLVPYLLVAALGLVTLSATGHVGGNLVYEHGAGVRQAAVNDAAFARPSLAD